MVASNVLAYEVDFIQLAAAMSGKGSHKKGQSLDGYQKEYKKIGNRLRELRLAAGYTAALDFAYQHDLQPF